MFELGSSRGIYPRWREPHDYALAYLSCAVPYLVDGPGAVSGRRGAFGLLTAIIAVLALWMSGYAIRSGQAPPPASESYAAIGKGRPVRQEILFTERSAVSCVRHPTACRDGPAARPSAT